MLLILVIFGFNSQIRFNSKNEFNVPSGKQGLNKNRRNVLIDFSNKIKKNKILFQNKDFNFINKLLDKKEINQDDFFYFDPPYSITNATYNTYWNNKDDLELFNLLDLLNGQGIRWALSNVFEANGKKNDELIKWSQKYTIKYLSKDYKNSNYQRKNLDKDVEVLIINYEI